MDDQYRVVVNSNRVVMLELSHLPQLQVTVVEMRVRCYSKPYLITFSTVVYRLARYTFEK